MLFIKLNDTIFHCPRGCSQLCAYDNWTGYQEQPATQMCANNFAFFSAVSAPLFENRNRTEKQSRSTQVVEEYVYNHWKWLMKPLPFLFLLLTRWGSSIYPIGTHLAIFCLLLRGSKYSKECEFTVIFHEQRRCL